MKVCSLSLSLSPDIRVNVLMLNTSGNSNKTQIRFKHIIKYIIKQIKNSFK